ncbi:hypothetical protein ACFW96_28685 [Streptomyces gardneri]|uniref:hypothetical protein n=1 Tax=Streptomyces gardneri TaxID=66892 RepID=UPI0036CBFCC3
MAGGPRPRRRHPLTDTRVTALTPGRDLEEKQRLTNTALAAPDRMARWLLYGTGGVLLRTALRDLKSLGALVLNHATNADLHSVAPGEVLERLEAYRTNPLSARSQRHPDTRRSDVHSYFAPDDAAATAVAITAGLRILCAADIPAAADASRWLTERGHRIAPGHRRRRRAGSVPTVQELEPRREEAEIRGPTHPATVGRTWHHRRRNLHRRRGDHHSEHPAMNARSRTALPKR